MAPNVAGSNPVSHPNLTNFHFPFKFHAFVVFRSVRFCPTFSEMQHGYFDDELEAARCYNDTAKKLGQNTLSVLPDSIIR